MKELPKKKREVKKDEQQEEEIGNKRKWKRAFESDKRTLNERREGRPKASLSQPFVGNEQEILLPLIKFATALSEQNMTNAQRRIYTQRRMERKRTVFNCFSLLNARQ